MAAGNRWCILPMEGWDGTADGHPSDLTRRRWTHFGQSGAKIIWGGEAVAVRHDGRANPNQLVINADTLSNLADLRQRLIEAHREQFGRTDDLLIGLQLTHSGRYARPTTSGPAPRVAYRHPVLDRRLGITDDGPVFTDAELDRLVEDFVAPAAVPRTWGSRSLDIKHCHGYSGTNCPARGIARQPAAASRTACGSWRASRRASAPGAVAGPGRAAVGLRLVPFEALGRGREPEPVREPYDSAFGYTAPGAAGAIEDADAFLSRLPALGIGWVCVSAGSPYYNPHIQRPAVFPPSDGYLPPEDPLIGVARQIEATAALKRRHPELVLIGSGYSYLQEWLPHVAEHAIRHGLADAIGLGRMVLSYPDLPADILAGRPIKTKLLCRTFSDCTTAPRNGLVSGCYPLDKFYAQHPDAAPLKLVKK